MRMFDYCVSNPPYQLAVGEHDSGRTQFIRIYEDFHTVSLRYARSTNMIYPATWQSNVNRGLGRKLLQHGLHSVNNFNGSDVFGESITVGYPISAVHCEEGYVGDITVNSIQQSRDLGIFIDREDKNILLQHTAKTVKLPQLPLTKALPLSHLHQLKDDERLLFTRTPELLHNPVSVYVKLKGGTQADASNWYIENKDITPLMKRPEIIDLFTVSVPQRFFKQSRLVQVLLNTPGAVFNAKVFPAGFLHGETYREVRSFTTIEEAENFAAYLNCRAVAVLLSCGVSLQCFTRYTPDLLDYSNSNPVFTPDDDLPVNHPYRGLALPERLLHEWGVTIEDAERLGLLL